MIFYGLRDMLLAAAITSLRLPAPLITRRYAPIDTRACAIAAITLIEADTHLIAARSIAPLR